MYDWDKHALSLSSCQEHMAVSELLCPTLRDPYNSFSLDLLLWDLDMHSGYAKSQLLLRTHPCGVVGRWCSNQPEERCGQDVHQVQDYNVRDDEAVEYHANRVFGAPWHTPPLHRGSAGA